MQLCTKKANLPHHTQIAHIPYIYVIYALYIRNIIDSCLQRPKHEDREFQGGRVRDEFSTN